MSWQDDCLSFMKKYGKAAKVVASGVLNVVAPGSGSLLSLVDLACDRAGEIAQDHWEASLLKATQNNTAELQRLGQLFELLSGDLAGLCDKAAASAAQPEKLPDILRAALAADPSLSRVLHQVESIKVQFTAVQGDLRRIARNQEEALPVYARINRVADYFDEFWQAGIRPKDFAQQLKRQQEVAARITRGDTRQVDEVIGDLRKTAPKAASLCVLEAAAAARDFNYPAAQRALATALRLRPKDKELLELSRRVTLLETTATPGPEKENPSTEQRLQPGDTLDGWLLEARLGAGGWGQVFKATRRGQTRAVKVMHPEYAADADFVDRFKKEIASLLRLPRHPNLVSIEASTAFGYCTERRTWYLAMDYIDGRTLESYLATYGPLTEGQVRKLFPDAIAGLAVAHQAGIVHRDVKPGNLIIRKSDQRLVFVDFGLAVGVEELGQTKVGGISIQFAAPEQHYGKSATQASDVFSLCAVIHYALHYDKPERRTPNEFSPALVPEALRPALTRGMMTSATERLQNAGQLLEAMQGPPVVIAQPKEARSPAPPPQPPVATPAQPPRQEPPRRSQAAPPQPAHREAARQSARSRHPLLIASLAFLVFGALVSIVLVVNRRPPRTDANSGERATPIKLPSNPQRGDTITNKLGMKFAWVPPGKSWLGGGGGQVGTKPFTLNQGLWCGVYEVAQGEWQAVTGKNPSNFQGNPRFPVENVSWSAVDGFIQQLNQQCSGDGLVYRLPTEDEWEYICRGGQITQDQSKYHFYFARSKTDLTPNPSNDLSSTQANFCGYIPAGAAAKGPNLERTCEVGLYIPNPLGIYDLHGNVWECTSSADGGGSGRVFRGGGWNCGGDGCTASDRIGFEPGDAISNFGCRLLAVPSGQ